MINRENYHAVKEYVHYQADVLQRDPLTIYDTESRLKHLLRWADDKSFAGSPNIRPVFPRYLLTVKRPNGKPLAPIGVSRLCLLVRSFFKWLAERYPRKYSLITAAWINTIYPPAMPDEPPKERQAVTLDVVRKLITVPHRPGDLRAWRDKAAVAFLFLSGMRSAAFTSLTLECVDIDSRTVKQYPTMGVRTKKRKAAITRLLPIPDLLAVVKEWDSFVRSHLPVSACWFTLLDGSFGRQVLKADRPGRFRHSLLSDSLRLLFDKARLPYMSPHKFRHGHALYGLKASKNIADLKAVSQNLMHANIGITDGIYAVLSADDVQERIARLGVNDESRKTEIAQDRIAAIVSRVLAEMEAEGKG